MWRNDLTPAHSHAPQTWNQRLCPSFKPAARQTLLSAFLPLLSITVILDQQCRTPPYLQLFPWQNSPQTLSAFIYFFNSGRRSIQLFFSVATSGSQNTKSSLPEKEPEWHVWVREKQRRVERKRVRERQMRRNAWDNNHLYNLALIIQSNSATGCC